MTIKNQWKKTVDFLKVKKCTIEYKLYKLSLANDPTGQRQDKQNKIGN